MTARVSGFDTLRHALQVLAFCCVVAVFTSLIWTDSSYLRQLGYAVAIGMITWAVIEFGRLLVPPENCYRNPEGGGHGWPKGWRGLALTAAGIAAGFALGRPLGAWMAGESVHSPQRDLFLALLVTVTAGVVASYYFHVRGRQSALQAEIAAAERDAGEARLRLLQSQLEPHMLFNTLANLRALIGTDPAAAQTMLDRLDGYLRATLAASRSATQHPLADEFQRLSDYLQLMSVRMGPRLAATLDLPAALRELPVPPLILQPLVENAIRHGLEPQVAGGRIDVSAQRAGGMLRLTVTDTGIGFDPAAVRPGRFGLAQVRERVESATQGRGRVSVQSAPGAGTTIGIELPIDTRRA